MVPVDRVPGELVLDDVAYGLFLGLLDVQGIDIGAGHHDLLHGAVHELEDAVDQLLLGPVEDTLEPALFQEHLDLLLPDHLIGLLETEEPHDRRSRSVEDPHGERERLREHLEHGQEAKSRPLAVIDTDILGHKLPGHHDHIGEHDDHHNEGDHLGEGAYIGEAPDQGLDVGDRNDAADGRGEGADDGDPDLHEGEEVLRFVAHVEQYLGPFLPALLHHLLEPALPGGDDGKLPRREYPVQDDEGNDDGYGPEEAMHRPSLRIPLPQIEAALPGDR